MWGALSIILRFWMAVTRATRTLRGTLIYPETPKPLNEGIYLK